MTPEFKVSSTRLASLAKEIEALEKLSSKDRKAS
jgi:hypothetical protein